MPCSTPITTTTAAVASASWNSPGLSRQMSRKPGRSTSPTGDREDDGAKHALRQILQRAGQKEEYERDDCGGGEVRELASPAGALDHSGLRRTTIDHECAAERRGRIGRRQSEEVGVFVERFAMARRIGARRRGALGDDHHKARGRHREQRQGLLPAHLRHTEARQASGHRPNDGDAMRREVECGTCHHRTHDGEERAGQPRCEPAAGEDDRHDCTPRGTASAHAAAASRGQPGRTARPSYGCQPALPASRRAPRCRPGIRRQ